MIIGKSKIHYTFTWQTGLTSYNSTALHMLAANFRVNSKYSTAMFLLLHVKMYTNSLAVLSVCAILSVCIELHRKIGK